MLISTKTVLIIYAPTCSTAPSPCEKDNNHAKQCSVILKLTKVLLLVISTVKAMFIFRMQRLKKMV